MRKMLIVLAASLCLAGCGQNASGGKVDNADSTELTETVKEETSKQKDDSKNSKKAIKKNDKVAKTMEITRDMVTAHADGKKVYSFERSAKAPGEDIEYDEIQSADSDEPVYLWGEVKNGQSRIKYYSDAYNIDMRLDPSPWNLGGLTVVELPEGVTEIPDQVFKTCYDLQKVILPESVKKIGESAFENCSSLKAIEIPLGVEEIDREAFSNSALESIALPPKLKCVEPGTFNNCENLASVTLNEGLEEIGDGAFAGTAITELTMPSTLQKIGIRAFGGCGLLSLTLNEGLESIEESAFGGCEIKPLTLPSTLKTLGDDAFEAKVIEGQLPDGLETISGRLNENTKVNSNFIMDENGVIFNKEKTAILATTKDIAGEYRIPDGIVSIEREAFIGQTISNIIWNQELETIGHAAFRNCKNLTSISPVPAGVKALHSTFRGCSNLENVVVPGTVEALYGTFDGCKNLTSVTLEEGIKEINTAFEGCEKLQNVVYPKGCKVN